MTREPAEPLRLDYLIKAGTVHSMAGQTYRAIGVRGAEIAAVSAGPAGLDDLAGPETLVADTPEAALLPAFADSHEHLMEASRNTLLVPVAAARSVAEFTGMISEAARGAAPGAWILTSMSWHESNLAENRMPTGAELDAAAPGHPVLARRGGHLAVASAAALEAAGIGPDTPDPAGGRIGRLPGGQPSGLLEGGAVYQVAAFAPKPATAELAAALGTGSAAYAALGVGTIREAMVTLDDLPAYAEAWRRGLLSVRARPMIRVGNELTAAQALDMVRGLGAWSGLGDDWLRIWGLKFVLDGGVEGGALEQPYAHEPTQSGHLNWDPGVMIEVCTEAVRRGWRIGTHAAGDRAVRTLLDVYEGVVAATGPLPPWTLVIEHALLSDRAQRERAVRNGFGITVQHTLLWNMGSEMLVAWGPERTRQVNPLDDWLTLGASLAAGTDLARPVSPLLNVWGMVTRGTRAGRDPGGRACHRSGRRHQAVHRGHRRTERRLRQTRHDRPGKLADVVAYPADPLAVSPGDLPGLTPVFTMVGGRPVYDPGGLFAR